MTSLAIPRLHLIGPLGELTPEEYVSVAAQAARGGVDAIHVRLPGAPGDTILQMACDLRRQVEQAALIVNDRLDVAMLANADGVQLGERSFRVEDARRLLGMALLIGRSIHDIDGARVAQAEGADYVLAGHVFDTPSKEGTPGRGLDWLADTVSSVSIPVIALGGITVDRLPSVLATGAHGVAVGRELLLAANPEAVAMEMTHAIRRHGDETP